MSEIAKIRDLFASFEKGSLDSLVEAIEIVEDVLKNGDAGDKEIAKNCFKTYKDKQLAKAQRILKEEDDFRKMDECWNVLNEFSMAESANSPEDIVELNKIKNEVLIKAIHCNYEKVEGNIITFKKNSPLTPDNMVSYIIKKYEKDVPNS